MCIRDRTITVPANSSNDYPMKNDEWSVKVSIDKIDSETKQRIKGCLLYTSTLFFELARLAEARKPPYLLFENVVGLINHDHCRTFATILNTLDRLGYGCLLYTSRCV